jgi:CBS domain-containing protein
MALKIVPDIIDAQILCEFGRDDGVLDAAKAMAERRIGAVLITRSGRLEGIVTERDLAVRVIAQGRDPATTKLGDIMTKNPEVLGPNDKPEVALERMRAGDFRHLPVLDGTRVIGVVSIRDLYAVVKGKLEDDIKSREAFIFGNGHGGLS